MLSGNISEWSKKICLWRMNHPEVGNFLRRETSGGGIYSKEKSSGGRTKRRLNLIAPKELVLVGLMSKIVGSTDGTEFRELGWHQGVEINNNIIIFFHEVCMRKVSLMYFQYRCCSLREKKNFFSKWSITI